MESAPGEGTTVRIRLPVHVEQPPLVPGPSSPAPGPQRLQVLVVDDEQAVREVVMAYLASDGHTVVAAANGREAWERFQAAPADLVVTDRAMPEMNGEQVAALVKAVAPGTPVILLTGFGPSLYTAGARPPGVDAVVGKPVTLAALRQALATVTAAERPRHREG